VTAIALLNVEADPHIGEDTLISAQVRNPKSLRLVWLPAQGLVSSEYKSPEGDWYIARLGRKTFFLPNGAGILAFAGDCQAAFQFWAALSEKYLVRESYEPSFRIAPSSTEPSIR
jgi:hypothetical protein